MLARPPGRADSSAIDDAVTVALSGNRHPLARPEYDTGAVAPDTRMERMILVLQPDADQQAALDALTEAQQDPNRRCIANGLRRSSSARALASPRATSTRSARLGQHGFTVDEIAAGRRQIVFSGSAAQVAQAFHTEVHGYMAGRGAEVRQCRRSPDSGSPGRRGGRSSLAK